MNLNTGIPIQVEKIFHKVKSETATGFISSDIFVDWIGNKWTRGLFPHIPDNAPSVDIPINGDGIRAGRLEWLAFGLALEILEKSEDRYSICLELGSSQAPWCLSWIRAVQRINPDIKIDAIGVEAGLQPKQIETFWELQELDGKVFSREKFMFNLKFEHNFESKSGNSNFFVLKRAVTASHAPFVFFPAIDITKDNGASISKNDVDVDYRGFQIKSKQVETVNFESLVKGFKKIDFLHMDLQGEELFILKHIVRHNFSKKCKVMLIGTHSKRSHLLWKLMMPLRGYKVWASNPPVIVKGTLVEDGELVFVSRC